MQTCFHHKIPIKDTKKYENLQFPMIIRTSWRKSLLNGKIVCESKYLVSICIFEIFFIPGFRNIVRQKAWAPCLRRGILRIYTLSLFIVCYFSLDLSIFYECGSSLSTISLLLTGMKVLMRWVSENIDISNLIYAESLCHIFYVDIVAAKLLYCKREKYLKV